MIFQKVYLLAAVAAVESLKLEVVCVESTGKPLRVPHLTPGGTSGMTGIVKSPNTGFNPLNDPAKNSFHDLNNLVGFGLDGAHCDSEP